MPQATRTTPSGASVLLNRSTISPVSRSTVSRSPARRIGAEQREARGPVVTGRAGYIGAKSLGSQSDEMATDAGRVHQRLRLCDAVALGLGPIASRSWPPSLMGRAITKGESHQLFAVEHADRMRTVTRVYARWRSFSANAPQSAPAPCQLACHSETGHRSIAGHLGRVSLSVSRAPPSLT